MKFEVSDLIRVLVVLVNVMILRIIFPIDMDNIELNISLIARVSLDCISSTFLLILLRKRINSFGSSIEKRFKNFTKRKFK